MFMEQIQALSGQNIRDCFYCGRCAAGCPGGPEADLTVPRVFLLIRLGEKDRLFQSSFIWQCMACHTCDSRCPQGLEIPAVMDALRLVAFREKRRPALPRAAAFYKIFADIFARSGKVNEAELMGRHNLATMQLFQNAELGLRLGWNGRLSPVIPQVKERKALKKLLKDWDREKP